MEQWTSTTDTREATAFGTLGMPVKLITTLVERTGQRITRFHIGLISACGKHRTGKILTAWRNGSLEKNQPGHDFLTVLRGIRNWNALLDLQKKGTFCHLERVPGTAYWQYVAGPYGLPGIDASIERELLKTRDIKAVAALGIAGVPLLHIVPAGALHTYYLPRYGPPLIAGGPPIDAVALLAAWRADRASAIPLHDGFATAYYGLHNRERFLDAVKKDVELILIQKPRSQRAAVVRSDASSVAFDSVKDHFDKP